MWLALRLVQAIEIKGRDEVADGLARVNGSFGTTGSSIGKRGVPVSRIPIGTQPGKSHPARDHR